MARKSSKSIGGRPAKPAGERATPVNTTISPAVREYLTATGDGSASRGARLVLIRAAELARDGKNIIVGNA